MADGNELVELAVNDKGRARHVLHSAQIIELLGKQEAQEANLVGCDTLD